MHQGRKPSRKFVKVYYRITPHLITRVAPCELLMKCRLRSRFNLLHPDVSEKVESQQEKQVESHDNIRPLNASTCAKNLVANISKWIAGTVTRVTGPLSYLIWLDCQFNATTSISQSS